MTIDAFVLLTPILLLAVVALLGFVGCNQVFGINPVILEIETSNIVPSFGPGVGGTQVQIFGSNLSHADGLTFGGIPAQSLSSINDREFDGVTPSSPPGTVVVSVTSSNPPDGNDITFAPLYFTYVAISFVQAQSTEQPGNNPPVSVTVNNTTAGNLLVAAVSYGGPATGSVTVSDNLGNAFTLAGNAPWVRQSRIFYLPNIPGGNVTITATGAGGAAAPCTMCVSEYSGADPSAAAVYGFSTKASPSTGTPGIETMQGVAVTPAQSGDIVYAVVFAARSTSLMGGPGFTPHASPATTVLVEDTASAVAAAQPVATDDTTGGAFVPWVILAVAIKA